MLGGVQVTGVLLPDMSPVVEATLPHGKDPKALIWDAGFVVLRALSATRQAGDISVTYLVAQATPASRPPHRHRRRTGMPTLQVSSGEVPVQSRRTAAYGIVTSERGVLATTIAVPGPFQNLWWLPGGCIEPDETPSAAVIREVWEETEQEVAIDRFAEVLSEQYLRRADGKLQNYHALRLIYLAHCDTPTDPKVLDIGGSTGEACWVPTDQWRRLKWAPTARTVLGTYLT